MKRRKIEYLLTYQSIIIIYHHNYNLDYVVN